MSVICTDHAEIDFLLFHFRLLNPIPYYAQYYGHKLHVDQNEKLVRYGVTHVAAAGGKLINIITMPIKNPIVITYVYEQLYR